MADNIDTLVIACMDYRLNAVLDEKYNNGHAIFFRNAGGDVAPLIGDIEAILKEHPGIKKIIVVKHTNEGTLKENELTCGGATITCMVAERIDIPPEARELAEPLLKSEAVQKRFGASREYAKHAQNLRDFEVYQSVLQANRELEPFRDKGIVTEVIVERVKAKDSNSHMLLVGFPTGMSVGELAEAYGNDGIRNGYIILIHKLSKIKGDMLGGFILVKMNKLHIEAVYYLAPQSMKLEDAKMNANLISIAGEGLAVAPMMMVKNGARSKSKA